MFNRFEPRPGGLARLRRRLSEAERLQRFELRLMGVMASLLMVIFISLSNWSAGEKFQISQGIQPEQGQAVEIPTGTPGIRFYWVVR